MAGLAFVPVLDSLDIGCFWYGGCHKVPHLDAAEVVCVAALRSLDCCISPVISVHVWLE